MGDVADAIMDGELCEMCAVYIPGPAPGHPRHCSNQCRRDAQPAKVAKPNPNLLLKKSACPICYKKVKEVGLADHMKSVHGEIHRPR